MISTYTDYCLRIGWIKWLHKGGTTVYEDNIPTMTLKGMKVLYTNATIFRRDPSPCQLLWLSITAFTKALHANAFQGATGKAGKRKWDWNRYGKLLQKQNDLGLVVLQTLPGMTRGSPSSDVREGLSRCQYHWWPIRSYCSILRHSNTLGSVCKTTTAAVLGLKMKQAVNYEY